MDTLKDVGGSPDPRLKESTRKGDRKIKLITVHGTGAGDTTATGDKWWQLGSNFMTELSDRLDLDAERVELAPFQWEEGPNSEMHRRLAGGQLLKRLQDYEAEGSDYFIIGHSHGGSVIYNTLLQAVQRRVELPHLKQWCTVGTPFLYYRPNSRLWQRLSTAGLTFFLSGIVAWLIVVSYLFALYVTGWTTEYTSSEFLRNVTFILAAYGTLCIVALMIWERRGSNRATKTEREQVDANFSSRWMGFWHPEDEAISALINVKGVSGPMVPPTFLQPIAAGAQLAIVLGAGIWMAYDTIRNGILLELLVDDLEFVAAMLTDSANGQNATVFVLVCMLFLSVSCLILLAAWVLKKALLLAGLPLSVLINRVIWRSVRDRAWGDDLTQEGVHAVAAHPPLFEFSFDPLPELVSAPLRQHSDSNAIDTLNKVRLILGMSRESSAKSDIKTELAESLRWKELIHTSYFDVPSFIDMLALGLCNAGLAPVRKSQEISSEHIDEMNAWFAGHSAMANPCDSVSSAARSEGST